MSNSGQLRSGGQWRALLLGSLPYILALYPASAVVTAHSETPTYFSRYSASLLALLVATCLVFLTASVAGWSHSAALQCLAYVLLMLWTFPVVGNNHVKQLRYIQVVLPGVRVLASMALVYIGFLSHRAGRIRLGAACLSMGVAFGFVVGIADMAIGVSLAMKPVSEGFGFRENYRLGDISANDLVLIGDSYVWGQGVRLEETFGKVLERDLNLHGIVTRVFMLGQIGSGPKQYIEVAKAIPANHRAHRVLVAFFHNDMPEKEGGVGRYVNIAQGLGNSSGVLRMLIEAPLRRVTPDVDSYNRYLIGQYDKQSSTFDQRWKMLRDDLASLRVEASKHSELTPAFIVIPLSVDYDSYPLMDVEKEIRELASGVGFQSIDVFPALKNKLRNGAWHCVASNDCHFDAYAYEALGKALTSEIWR